MNQKMAERDGLSNPIITIEVACVAPRPLWPDISCVIVAYVRMFCCAHRVYSGDLLPTEGSPEAVSGLVRSIRVVDMSGVFGNINEVSSTATYVPVLFYLHTDDEDNDADAGAANGVGSADPQQPFMFAPDPDTDDALPSCSVLPLPHASLEGMWDSLHYGETSEDSTALKRDLLQYIHTALYFSLAEVDASRVAFNRLLLFHGVPGTGKTSLCKALAQKISIHMAGMFASAKLVEINAHSLFSRWFSESGKQVMALFEHIRRIARDETCLVFVLVDEVESLAAARQSAMKGNEPSDSIRVVNALLTQLDRLQRLRNVLVLVTSNLTGAIDVAFLDRTDKKVQIGPPGFMSRRAVLLAGMRELHRSGLLTLEHLDDRASAITQGEAADRLSVEQLCSQELDAVTQLSEGFNGRTLKRLPFLTFSTYAATEQISLLRASANSAPIARPRASVAMQLSQYFFYLRRSIEGVLAEGAAAH